MADTKVSNFPPSAGLVLTDIFPVVDDPGGTPQAQKATFSQLATLLGTGNFVLKSGDTMTGALVHPVGAVGTPSITFTGDLDTGVYSPGANVLGITAGTNLVARFSASEVVLYGVSLVSGVQSNWNNAQLVTTDFTTDVGGFGGVGNGTTFTIWGFNTPPDPNDPAIPALIFKADSTLDIQKIGFFTAATAGATVFQQSAPTSSLAEVVAALKAYGLLAP